ncbi:MAG: hypothetical protein A3G18_10110 [Rhodospirillales bacterium RIFCSPLOWO2_12_FULL_58_28]|nr:MAG: hypothetical protein A3H92_08285 [Rhodospirillales bacterium RIFCSPLOWO2_02_FULL_58_16]OHC77634.1 MAG: hypothetical protein A3G18_10110 [Rhodospirillales bacterium RIFCSPLOWO2_12_FULL_58_28]
MSTIVPLPLPLPIMTSSTPLPSATVLNPPTPLTLLAVGTKLEGTVIQQDAKSVFQVQTSLGAFAVQTAVSLPQGATLSLQVSAFMPQIQMQIISVNGKTLRQVVAQQAAGKEIAPTAAGGATAGGRASPPSLIVGGTVTATLLRPPSGQTGGFSAEASRGPQGALLPQGAPGAPQDLRQAQQAAMTAPPPQQAGIRTAQVALPGQQGAPNRPATLLSAAPAAVHRPGAAPGNPAAVPVGAQVTVKVISLQFPRPDGPLLSLPQAGTAGLAAGQNLNGIVIGASPFGRTLVMTEAGELSLAVRSSLPEGSALTLQVTGKPLLPATPAQVFTYGSGEGMFASRDWPAFREAMAALQDADPVAARHLLNNIIPRPDSQLAANVLFFLTALRGGNLRSWFGDEPALALQRARPELLARLKDDFNTLGRMSKEPSPSDDWKITLVPFFNGAGLEQIRLLTRRHGGDNEKGEEQESTRFVIDVDLSKLGRLQLDGLLRNKGKHMDLIVRTDSRLPDQMQNDIRNIFQDAAELTGIKGGVGFQASPPNFTEVLLEKIIVESDRDGLIV